MAPPRGILSRSLILLLSAATALVSANVEKLIFLGPEAVNIPLTKPSLPELNLPTLTPEDSSLRTNLSRVFPSPEELIVGEPAWVLFDNLTAGQRYEFRVCWAAIEPTSFTLDVYELDTVWQTPELVQSLATYAYSRMPDPSSEDKGSASQKPAANDLKERTASVLLLHIQAAADYFTHDAVLMQNPPPVLVDLILDPYVLNVVPRSLLPTAGYLVVLAILSWFAAQWIAKQLQSIAGAADHQAKQQKKKNK